MERLLSRQLATQKGRELLDAEIDEIGGGDITCTGTLPHFTRLDNGMIVNDPGGIDCHT